ncbi:MULTISPECIES: alpha/beta hydrolase-fold protein [unclassified Enterococcus]|uniref:alpha/beta hydrolase n=1 Tax=unclassified Enterococcus TaxID=2608891 RepID=UPI0015574721|nr:MULTISPECIES: alpha/beta hydrolase-fold protein [unclassified Enterococcus]MBS7576755.1 alpha/beta hydrolase [Enterococcus sp. MMGLQ5-2]MBS7583758.1 alpha/beta hydrolase [Enterococcus sp. MMGLQ5-1]NPD11619.1 alpha/beta hydrolase [Enterococcus sp. MMGLQ5-1]NPD36592.1 alpha/beta hydrolase [Enterococcus sp. MMGLQ5-2]
MKLINKKVDNYYLDIYYPESIKADKKLPVLYVLDGDAFTQTIAEAVKLQTRNSPKTGVQPMIIVGICYRDQSPFSRDRRFIDYTPAQKKVADPQDIRSQLPAGGGIELFLKVVKLIHQLISDEFSIDSRKVGFYGHSLGGLCVLECLLRKEMSFLTDYLAVSPSLWWDQEAYFEKLNQINGNILRNRRVMISVGSREGDMVPLAKRAASWFQANQFAEKVSFYLAEDENHMSVVFTTISRYLRWFSSNERK